jgi:hypothetical protein
MNLSRVSPAGRGVHRTHRTSHAARQKKNTSGVQPGAVAVATLAEPSLLSGTDAGGSFEPDAPIAQMAMPFGLSPKP